MFSSSKIKQLFTVGSIAAAFILGVKFIGSIADTIAFLDAAQNNLLLVVGIIVVGIWMSMFFVIEKAPTYRTLATIAAILLPAIIILFFGAYRLSQAYDDLLTLVLLITSAMAIYLILFYFTFSETAIKVLGNAQQANSALPNSWKYPNVRKWALYMLCLLPMFTLGFLLYQIFIQSRAVDKFVIVLVEFNDGTPPDPDDYFVTSTVRDELQSGLSTYQDIELLTLNAPLTDDTKQISAIAQRYHASVVIWGAYRVLDKVRLTVNFQITKPLRKVPELSPEVRGQPQYLSRAQLSEFELQRDLSKRMTYLSLVFAGLQSYEKGTWSDAVQKLTNSLLYEDDDGRRSLNEAIVYSYRASAHEFLMNKLDALADFDAMLALENENYYAYQAKARVYNSLKQYNAAIDAASMAIKYNQSMSSAYVERGVAFYNKNDMEKALVDFSTAISIDSQEANTYNWRGFIYSRLGNYELAIKDYTRAINLNSDRENYYYNRGVSYIMLDNFAEAKKDFVMANNLHESDLTKSYLIIIDISELIQKDSSNYKNYLDRAVKFESVKLWERAFNDYAKVVNLDKDNPTAHFGRGNVYYERKDFQQAIEDYTQAIELGYAYPGYAYRNRALCWEKNKEYQKAIDDLDRALELQAKYFDAAMDRGRIHEKMGLKDDAKLDYRLALLVAGNTQEEQNAQAALSNL